MLCKLHSSRSGIIRFGSMGIISAELSRFATLRTALCEPFSTPYVATKLIVKIVSLQIFGRKSDLHNISVAQSVIEKAAIYVTFGTLVRLICKHSTKNI